MAFSKKIHPTWHDLRLPSLSVPSPRPASRAEVAPAFSCSRRIRSPTPPHPASSFVSSPAACLRRSPSCARRPPASTASSLAAPHPTANGASPAHRRGRAHSATATTTAAPTSAAVRGAPGERRRGLRRRGSRSRCLAASARRAGRRAGQRALAAHLGRPHLQRRRVGDGHGAGLGLRGENGAPVLERPLLGNGSTSWWSDVRLHVAFLL